LNYEQNLQVILDYLNGKLSRYAIDSMTYPELQLAYDKLTTLSKEHYVQQSN
jgi:hypothetical protein